MRGDAIGPRAAAVSWAILLGSLVATGVTFGLARLAVEQAEAAAFEDEADAISGGIAARLEEVRSVLRALRGLYVASHEVEQDEWDSFVATLEIAERVPAVRAVGFARAEGGRLAVERFTRTEGGENGFVGRDLAADAGGLLPLLATDDHLVALPAPSVFRPLLGDHDDTDLLALRAVPAKGNETGGLDGAVFAVVCLPRLFSDVVKARRGTASAGFADGPPPAARHRDETIGFGGEVLRVRIVRPDAGKYRLLPWLCLAAGICFSFVLFFLFRSAFRSRGRAVAARRTLEEAHRRLTETDALRRDFVATVAHELRTPTTSLLGSLELLERDLAPSDPRAAKALAIAARNARRLSRLVERLLDRTAIDAGRIALELRPVAVEEVVREAWEELAREERVSLTVSVMPETPAGRADRDRLRQVLRNLLENAVRFARSHVLVTIRPAPEAKGFVEVVVEDDGPGIPEEDLPDLFRRYRHGKDRHGIGLGLSIARDLVEAQGGTIAAGNRIEGGAIFTVRLPAATVGG